MVLNTAQINTTNANIKFERKKVAGTQEQLSEYANLEGFQQLGTKVNTGLKTDIFSSDKLYFCLLDCVHLAVPGLKTDIFSSDKQPLLVKGYPSDNTIRYDLFYSKHQKTAKEVDEIFENFWILKMNENNNVAPGLLPTPQQLNQKLAEIRKQLSTDRKTFGLPKSDKFVVTPDFVEKNTARIKDHLKTLDSLNDALFETQALYRDERIANDPENVKKLDNVINKIQQVIIQTEDELKFLITIDEMSVTIPVYTANGEVD